MKNWKMVRAWDAVNPTPAQKRRMRSALEARLCSDETPPKSEDADILDFTPPQSGPEKTGKHTQKARSQYQAVQPKKNRGSVVPLIAAMLAVVITGGVFLGMMQGRLKENPGYSPIAEDPTASTTQATENARLPDAYQEIIETYAAAIREGWNPEQCMNANISILTANVQSTDELGYALMDLDNDGEEELLITDGNVIYNMYSLTPEGGTVCWITGMERDAYYLSDDHIIANVGSGSAAIQYYIFYSFSNNSLDVIQQVTFNAEANPENPWFVRDMNENVTEERAKEIIDAYPHRYISHTTLSGQPPLPEAVLPEEGVLKLYAKELSTLLSGDLGMELELYCLADYDGDGEMELLLGKDKSIFMVLEETGQGKVGNAPFYISPSGAAYLCENSVVEYIGLNQGYSNFTYIKHGGEKHGETQANVFTDGEKWYTRNENTETITISDAAANLVRSNFKRLNLPWKRISQFPVAIPESSGEYITTLFKEAVCTLAVSEELTEDSLIQYLDESSLTWEREKDGSIRCDDPELPGAYLTWGKGWDNALAYTTPGKVWRTVMIRWVPTEGLVYWKQLGAYANYYRAESLWELREFLKLDDETMELWQSAQAFTLGYFGQSRAIMLEQMSSAWESISLNKMYDRSLEVEIQEMKGLEDVEERYLRDGYVEVTSAAYADSPDSLSYLTMKMVKENDQWKVSDFWLEK